MNKLVLRFGLYATLVTIGIPLLQYFFLDKGAEMNYQLGEIIGYSTIILSMVFVFLGIKKYRDENNDGSITFWEALKVGILIAAIPAIAFGLYNWVYIAFLDPEFLDNYYQHYLDQAQATMSVTEFEAEKTKLELQKAGFQSPVVQFVVMFLTVFILGFIVSLVSSIVLKKGEKENQNILDTNNG